MVEVRQFEVRVGADEEDLEALRVARRRIEELKAEHTSLTTGAEQPRAENGSLSAHIGELEGSAATCNGELGVIAWAKPFLKVSDAAGEYRRTWWGLGLASRYAKFPNFDTLQED